MSDYCFPHIFLNECQLRLVQPIMISKRQHDGSVLLYEIYTNASRTLITTGFITTSTNLENINNLSLSLQQIILRVSGLPYRPFKCLNHHNQQLRKIFLVGGNLLLQNRGIFGCIFTLFLCKSLRKGRANVIIDF